MVRYLAYIIVFFTLIFIGGEGLCAQNPKKPSDVYAKAMHLNEALVTLLRRHYGRNEEIKVSPTLLRASIQPRHVFQRALDVEEKVTALMRINGLDVREINTVFIRLYAPDQVFNVLQRIDVLVDRLLKHHGLEVQETTMARDDQQPSDVFHLLGRLEKFLLKMGAPATQPASVLKRAQAISFISSTLCTEVKCNFVKRQAEPEGVLFTPLHVYQETYRFIEVLFRYITQKKVSVEGGVLALPVEEGLILPMHVNRIMGVALADVMAIAHEKKKLTYYEFKATNPRAMPRDVWLEINFARRLLEVML